nr:DUF1295 domain-containing protein [Marinicella rhabdoformis]
MGCQVLAWLWQFKHKNADSVDLTWAGSISLIAGYYLLNSQAAITNMLLVVVFPVAWYARLTLHLWLRIDKKHEDNRYQHLRAHWSENTQAKFLLFFIFQAVLSFLFSLPAYWVLTAPAIPVVVLLVALLWGLLCMIGVSVADWQLYQFKTNPNNNGKVCDQGLWAYSRHPNYFFEWLHWWVYPLVLFPSLSFCWALIVVFIMLYFLLNLTGIPFSEQQALKSRGEAYRAYQESTNAFILWRKK